MSVKAKSKRRLILLATAVLGIGLAGAGGYVVKKYRYRAYLAREHDAGLAAARDGKPDQAVLHLTPWLRNNPNDVEALTVYAKQRLMMDAADGSNVWDAIGRLRHLTELRPDDDEPRRQLMQLYARYGFTTESKDAAQAILDRHPGDVEAMRYKLVALSRLRQWSDALKTAEDWSKQAPDDAEAPIRAMGLMAQLERPAKDIRDRAARAGGKDPKSARALVLMGYAYLITDDLPTAQDLLRKAAAQQPATAEFARLLIDQLNRAGLYDESLAKLRELAATTKDPEAREALVRRMWESNRATEVVDLTGPDDAAAAKLGVEALALRSLALAQLNKADAARHALDQLRAIKNDTLADAWSAIVADQLDAGATSPRNLLDLCQKASRKDSAGGYLGFFAGQAYAALDEGDLAIEMWQRLAGENPTWSLPLIRLSEMRLSKGHLAIAMEAAKEAVRRSPNSAMAAVNLAKVWSANIEAGHTDRPDKLLELIATIRKELAQEETTIPMQVSLLASMKRLDEAKTEISQALKLEPAPAERTLLHLAIISHAHNLGLADACFDRCERAHGVTPGLAYARAIHRFSEGKAAEGLAILKDARKNLGDRGNTMEWELAWARYLEVTRDPAAKDEWVKLADGHPDDRAIQQMALNVPSTRADRVFTDRTIDRLRKLTGDEGVTWKLARGRWMLQGAKTDQELAQATVLLKDVIRFSPEAPEPRMLLAQAYERLNNVNGAVDELTAAAAADPGNTQVSLYLSRLLQKRGEFDKARQELDRLARNKTADPAQLRQAAALMAQQGDSQRAIELLQEGSATDEKTGHGGLLLAMLYRQRNEPAKAEEIVKHLLQNPDLFVVQFAADFYAQQGRPDDAQKALALLDGMKLKPGLKELLVADFACRNDTPEKAIGLLRAATKAAPDNPAAWRALIGFYAYLGRDKDLAAAVDEAARALPADEPLKAIAAQRDLLAQSAADTDAHALAVSFTADPKPDGPAVQGMQVLAAARKSDGSETPEQNTTRLRKAAEANPNYAPLQAILTIRYLRLGRFDDAAQVAMRAVPMFPNDADMARLGVDAMAGSDRWNEAWQFARTWRERTLTNPMPADIAISRCLQALGKPNDAAATLAPYVPKAVAQPQQNARLIVQYVSALAASNQSDKAAEVLWPMAQTEATWRGVWIQTAMRLPVQAAFAWLDRVEPLVLSKDKPQDAAVLATAWHQLGSVGKQPAATRRAMQVFDTLMARPDATAEVFLARGIAAEQDKDYPTAESCYRKALGLDGKSVIALNNLAMTIMKRGGDLQEAVKFAQGAVTQQPKSATLHDTLAQIKSKARDTDGAVASLRTAVSIEPNSLEWRVHLARVMVDGGRRKDAVKVMQEIAAVPTGSNNKPTEEVRSQLDALRGELAKEMSVSIQTP